MKNYAVMIAALLAILFMSVSPCAQELIVYGSVTQIKEGSIVVTSDEREIQISRDLMPGARIGETVKVVLGSEGVVGIERIEMERTERPGQIPK